MPGTKHRTQRRPNRRPPTRESKNRAAPSVRPPVTRTATAPVVSSAATSTATATPTRVPAAAPTASKRKLSKSPNASFCSSDSDDGSESECEGKGMRLLEVAGLNASLQEVCCKQCGAGPVVFKEKLASREGLCTHPYLFCESCSHTCPIAFSMAGSSKALAVNRKAVMANKCAGGSRASLQMLFGMLDLPPPVSKNVYTQHSVVICDQARRRVQASLEQAREELRQHYQVPSDEVADVLISCDSTWQKRGFSSLFGAVFIIAYHTGKVVDYVVLSKHCAGCKYWEGKDQATDAYRRWKDAHVCDANFVGSAGAMEPKGTLEMFQRSLEYKLRFKHLVSDGDSKMHSLLLQQQPYGPDPDHQVIKLDCVGHVQKRLGTALRKLKVTHRGQKLSDGKTIGGAGRLTDALINSLQNYYGDAIRRNKGNLDQMIKAVQATLLHCNSTDDKPRHHLCPEGERSLCKWQVAQALGTEYHHKNPIPEAIVQLLRPIYARLGHRSVLEKCVNGYTQNANESLHSVVWKFCPKELFLGKTSVDIACALAVSCFNDGASSLHAITDDLHLQPSPFCKNFLRSKDMRRIKHSEYKESAKGKELRRAARRKRKGLDDKRTQQEGVMYAPGAFDCDLPGPSKRARTQ